MEETKTAYDPATDRGRGYLSEVQRILSWILSDKIACWLWSLPKKLKHLIG